MSTDPTPLEAALAYAQRGWPVLPVYSIPQSQGKPSACSCRKGANCQAPGKHPCIVRWQNNATTDERTIRRWWDKWPSANVGIVTGKVSGLVVVDVDPRNDGDDGLAELERTHVALPETVEALTGGGGRHLLFRYPQGAKRIKSRPIGAGVDLKADGGFIVAPPSVHNTGKCYSWELSSEPGMVELAELPETWLRFIGISAKEGMYGSSSDSSPSSSSSACRPIPDYVRQLFEDNLPMETGTRRDCLKRIVLQIKKTSFKPQSAEVFRPTVREWHRRAVVSGHHDSDDSYSDFEGMWKDIRGDDPFIKSLVSARADSEPVACPYENPQRVLLAKALRTLARTTDGGDFYLASTQVARVFDMRLQNGELDTMKGWRWLQDLIRDGLLELVKRGKRSKRGGVGTANRYRYTGDDLHKPKP